MKRSRQGLFFLQCYTVSMRYRVSCGVIPIHIDAQTGEIRFLLVQGHGNYWGFPKGHKEKKETDLDTAKRELFEEVGLTCKSYLENTMYTERYRIRKKRGSDIIKKVLYFVGLVERTNVSLQTSELKKFGWFTFTEASVRLEKSRQAMLQQVYTLLTE